MGGDVVRAAGFDQHGEAVVAKGLHERQGVFLEQGFAAGEFDQGQSVAADAAGKARPSS